VEVVVPTIGRPSLASLLDVLATEAAPVRRVVLVDDRRACRQPLLPGGVPARLTGRVDVLAAGGRGPAAARNTGWRATRSRWVVFLDDDVVPDRGWGAALAADLGAAEVAGISAVQGRIRVPMPADRRPTDRERNVGRLHGARWITADFAVRRDALVSIGGFDERFPRAYREDADLSIRLQRAGLGLQEGRRSTVHPVGPAPWWISVRQQVGNADDVLMERIHGRHWQGPDRRRGRRRRHVVVTAAGLAGLAALAAGRPRVALAGGAGWLAGTVELAWARIAPGPRNTKEVAAMVATSVVLPAAATYHWLTGIGRARRLAMATDLAPSPGPTVRRDPAELAKPPLPRSLQVEVTASCNLRCPMCLVRYRPPVGRASGAMPLERFRRLLADLPTLDDVTLQGLGEPMLAPDIVEMVRLARARGARVGFNTNATVLTPERAAALVDAGLSWLAISLDGATAETYEAIRDGARLDRVLANVEQLVAAGRASPDGRGPALRFVFVAMRRNVHELPALVRLAHGWASRRCRSRTSATPSTTWRPSRATGRSPATRRPRRSGVRVTGRWPPPPSRRPPPRRRASGSSCTCPPSTSPSGCAGPPTEAARPAPDATGRRGRPT
jgi:pyruvate-formate lyase-activating enzyme